MIEETIHGKAYKLPNSLSSFQKDLYVHLIIWKWKHISKDVGYYRYKGKDIPYDAILPKNVQSTLPILYKPIINDLKHHLKVFPFKLHLHFNHMASSQAANINLFLPILLSPNANSYLRQLKPDFKELATGELYKGFRIEYWDGNSDSEKGLLGDHNARSGTDSDLAIAYYNYDNELCLWLIEHKLTETEFTECGAYKSKGRDKKKHICSKSFSEIVINMSLCYYHDVRKNNYWRITKDHKSFFKNHSNFSSCPFRSGINQLWRNQLLGFAIEDDPSMPFKNVFFSVVHHAKNKSLNHSIREYQELVDHDQRFTTFTSKSVIDKVSNTKDAEINKWIQWYCDLYKI